MRNAFASLAVAVILLTGVPVASTNAQAADVNEVGERVVLTTPHPARAARYWRTVLRYKGARIQICRESRTSGWWVLYVRLVNDSSRQVRKGVAWYKDVEWETEWTKRQESGWVNAGRQRIYAGLSTTGDLEDQRVRVRARTRISGSELRAFRWSAAPICPAGT